MSTPDISKFDKVVTLGLDENREEIERQESFAFIFQSDWVWPNQRFRIEFWYSNPADRWLWSVDHIGHGEIIRGPVVLRRPYTYDDRVLFLFIAPSSRPDRVDARNLGRTVRCEVYPQPQSPAYPFDL